MGTFEDELRALINRHSVENASNTPDFLLAEYIVGCLDLFAEMVNRRDKWFDFHPWDNKGAEREP